MNEIAATARRAAAMRDRIALAAIVALLVVLSATNGSADSSSPDRAFDFGAAWLLALATGLAFLGRRAPTIGALGNLVVIVVWYRIGYGSAIVNAPYLVAFYLLGASGDRVRQLVVGGIVVVSCVLAMAVAGEESTTSLLAAIGWTVAALLFGEVTHNRRALLRELQDRAARAEAERDREAQRRVAQARLEIARDLHDVLAHTVSVMTVQAGVGQDALDRSRDEVASALRHIRAAGQDAMAEVRALVAVLRNDAEPAATSPAPTLERVAELAEGAGAAGIEVDVHVDVGAETAGAVPELVQLTAYRVVQESLTNVVRHAGARRADVSVRLEPPDLVVEVADDGRGAAAEPADGFGLRGMRERVSSLGGTLTAGPADGSGWRVVARIPNERRSP